MQLLTVALSCDYIFVQSLYLSLLACEQIFFISLLLYLILIEEYGFFVTIISIHCYILSFHLKKFCLFQCNATFLDCDAW